YTQSAEPLPNRMAPKAHPSSAKVPPTAPSPNRRAEKAQPSSAAGLSARHAFLAPEGIEQGGNKHRELPGHDGEVHIELLGGALGVDLPQLVVDQVAELQALHRQL